MPRKPTKLLEINDLFNLRLIKSRRDILEILNSKRAQGIDTSEYVSDLIRKAEGLYPEINKDETPPAPPAPVINEADLVNQVIEKLKQEGFVLMKADAPEQTKADQDKEAENEEIAQAVSLITSWDDDDD